MDVKYCPNKMVLTGNGGFEMPGYNLNTALEMDPGKTTGFIYRFICDQVNASRAAGLVVGISGGLDSAVVAALGARALGPEKVKGLFLPERDTARDSYECARQVANCTGIRFQEIDLAPALEKLGCYRGAVAGATRSKTVNRLAVWFLNRFFHTDPYRVTLERTDNQTLNRAISNFRLKHRLRMAVLYQHADQENLLAAGCLNLTEHLTGFFVHYGDNAADLAPILDLYKSQIQQLARSLEVPSRILDKPPSPDLIPGIVDEAALAITYHKLDLVLYGLEKRVSIENIAKQAETEPEAVERIKDYTELSARFRKPIPYPPLQE